MLLYKFPPLGGGGGGGGHVGGGRPHPGGGGGGGGPSMGGGGGREEGESKRTGPFKMSMSSSEIKSVKSRSFSFNGLD